MTDEEELKARIKDSKFVLDFYSLYGDKALDTEWITQEEFEEAVNKCLDDISDATKKLKEME